MRLEKRSQGIFAGVPDTRALLPPPFKARQLCVSLNKEFAVDRLIGIPNNRLEDFTLINGQASFLDDLELSGMKECAFLRSPYPHALIKSIDIEPALNIPGVHQIFLCDDIISFFGSNQMPFEQGDFVAPKCSYPIILPQEEVCFAGEAVAVVIADSRYIAEDAVAAIEIDYEPLPAVADCRDGLQKETWSSSGPGQQKERSQCSQSSAKAKVRRPLRGLKRKCS